ncbi:MAG: hypothetical protein ABI639_08550 [Thermoanaerobaculia bacterium]
MFDSYATGVSADGSVIVGVALNPGVTAFRWTASTGMIDLGNPPGGYLSEAFAITPDGRTVVGNAGVDGSFVPMIWDEAHGMRNLIEVFVELGLGPSIAGWDLEEARAVSADGLTVVGYGFNPAGEREGWIADLRPASVVEVPTASTAALSILASLIVGAALLTMRLR